MMSALILVRGFWGCSEMSGCPYRLEKVQWVCNTVWIYQPTYQKVCWPESSSYSLYVDSVLEPRGMPWPTRPPQGAAVRPRTA